jgi:excisionase family DNA binding protein
MSTETIFATHGRSLSVVGFTIESNSMKLRTLQRYCRKELTWVEREPDFLCPGALAVAVDGARDMAAQLGLIELVKVAPANPSPNDCREYLTTCIAGCESKPSPDAPTLTTAEAAKLLKVNRSKILGWIAYGRLKAINTAKGALGRPRYRIKRTDLDDFLAGRTGRV